MNNNVLNWFRENFNDKRLESELLDVRKKDIKNILKILNDNFPISDGGPSWLETEEDIEYVANKIIEFEKQYNNETPIVDEKKDDNAPCECWNGPNHKGWACRIFCMNSNECDGITCKKDCDWYNGTGYFKVPKSVKKK
jgi:hypothetical protein